MFFLRVPKGVGGGTTSYVEGWQGVAAGSLANRYLKASLCHIIHKGDKHVVTTLWKPYLTVVSPENFFACNRHLESIKILFKPQPPKGSMILTTIRSDQANGYQFGL